MAYRNNNDTRRLRDDDIVWFDGTVTDSHRRIAVCNAEASLSGTWRRAAAEHGELGGTNIPYVAIDNVNDDTGL